MPATTNAWIMGFDITKPIDNTCRALAHLMKTDLPKTAGWPSLSGRENNNPPFAVFEGWMGMVHADGDFGFVLATPIC
jgi:hypothetical protein